MGVSRRARLALLASVVGLMAGCGGGGGGGSSGGSASANGSTCPSDVERAGLLTYMTSNYLWYRQIPTVDASTFGSLSAYLGGLLSKGVDGNDALPFDRWSGLQPTGNFQRFFGDGQALGFGVSVAGLEVTGTSRPLRVRYVEAKSPAAGLVQRGDTVILVNGRDATQLTQLDDFKWLETDTAGTVLNLRLRNLAGVERDVSLASAVYDLTPLSTNTVIRTPGGRAVGYLVLKDFISQASTPLATAMAGFRTAGVREVILDLRYNGGGLVSLARELASYLPPTTTVGRPFTSLIYSDKQAASNFTYTYSTPSSPLGLTRVYVLTGQRTCSASELVINGLKPFVNVVQIGSTSCGKPVGFVPLDNQCGSTISAVNFESQNALGAGRYWTGLVPTCPVTETWNQALGDPTEVLTAAALSHVDTGACPATASAAGERLTVQSSQMREALRRGVREGGEWRGMIDR